MDNKLQFSTKLSNHNLSDNSLFQTTKLVSPLSEESIGKREENENHSYFENTTAKYPIKVSSTLLPVYSISNISKGNFAFSFRNK